MKSYKLLVRNTNIAAQWFAVADEKNAQLKLKIGRDWLPAQGSEYNARMFVDRNKRDMDAMKHIGDSCVAHGFDVNVIVDDGSEYNWGDFFDDGR